MTRQHPRYPMPAPATIALPTHQATTAAAAPVWKLAAEIPTVALEVVMEVVVVMVVPVETAVTVVVTLQPPQQRTILLDDGQVATVTT